MWSDPCSLGADQVSQSSRCPLLLVFYEQYLDHQDSANYIRLVSESYTPGTLERLTQGAMREIRRAAVLALGFIGDYESNHALGRAMLDADRNVRILAENAIQNIWTRVGGELERKDIAVIIRLNTAQQYGEVVLLATRLIDRAPWFAEAWHQRAVAHFHQGHFAEAIRDGHQALEINPYHFVAATKMGQAYMELNNPVSALECFRRALRLNLNLEGVRAQVARLSRHVEGNP
jgi:tetratricopeptide (TPR) repeat protein